MDAHSRRFYCGILFALIALPAATLCENSRTAPASAPLRQTPGKSDAAAAGLRIFATAAEQLKARQMFPSFVQTRMDGLAEKRRSELARLKSPEEWRARQKGTRERLKEFFGEFPERTPLNARTVARIEQERCTIEKVIFESQPNYYVTANLYVPKYRAFPLPGVLFPCGHSDDGKGQDFYHMSGLGLAHKGYVALIYDPMGQGERSEYFDPGTGKPLVRKAVDQHHYVGKPAFLVDWTLSGLRLWDAVRALDYLSSRPEVDKQALAAAGCSGGGQMALLITAADPRIKVCAASHPGGSMENTYLLDSGHDLIDKEILSLIPPRPLRIIVGHESGEEPGHRAKIEDMQLFYDGLRAGKETCDLDMVPGIHSMSRSNRESMYEWLNKWLDREAEGKAESRLQPETARSLWCTESGNTIVSLGGETARSLTAKRARQVYRPESDPGRLRSRVSARIGLTPRPAERPLNVHSFGIVKQDGLHVEKLAYESEEGVTIPALLIRPQNAKPGGPVYVFASDRGKPERFENSLLPFALARKGAVVFAVDVRGIGETSPTPPLSLNRYTGYTQLLWRHDVPAIKCAAFGRTTLGMRALDLMRGVDCLGSRGDLRGRKVVAVGEGLGGLWALLAAIYDARVAGVAAVGTLPSYRLLIEAQYYDVWGYFFIPGALRDFDIPDLARLVAPKGQLWVDPVNALAEPLGSAEAAALIGSQESLRILTRDKSPGGDRPQEIVEMFQ